jgi:hypothetical protein
MGTETAKLFKKELGIETLKTLPEDEAFIAAGSKIGAVRSSIDSVSLTKGLKPVSTFYKGSDFIKKGTMIASSENNVGEGKIAGIYFNAGSDYLEYKSPVLRDFVTNHINSMFPGEIVKVSGSHLVHVTLNNINNKMYVNLINIAGEHTNQKAIGYDEIPSLKNITVLVNTNQKPARIILQPGGVELKVDYLNGISTVLIPEVKIHSILEVIM